MTAPHIIDPAGLLGEALAEASPDLMRSLLQTIINALLSADADAVAGAEWGRPSPGRTSQRNGYRHRELDTRVGTVDVAIPKLAMRLVKSWLWVCDIAGGHGAIAGNGAWQRRSGVSGGAPR